MKLDELMHSFSPHPILSGGILQTIFGSQFPGKQVSFQNKITHAIDLDENAKAIVYEIAGKDKMKPVSRLTWHVDYTIKITKNVPISFVQIYSISVVFKN